MKNSILAVLLLVTISSCSKVNDLVSANDDNSTLSSRNQPNLPVSQVPVAVMNAFKAKYPSAGGEIEWQKEDGNTYKVKFWLGAQRWQAIFNADGSFVSEKRLK